MIEWAGNFITMKSRKRNRASSLYACRYVSLAMLKNQFPPERIAHRVMEYEVTVKRLAK